MQWWWEYYSTASLQWLRRKYCSEFHRHTHHFKFPNQQPEENFYTCAWSYDTETGESLLIIAGFKGIIRVIETSHVTCRAVSEITCVWCPSVCLVITPRIFCVCVCVCVCVVIFWAWTRHQWVEDPSFGPKTAFIGQQRLACLQIHILVMVIRAVSHPRSCIEAMEPKDQCLYCNFWRGWRSPRRGTKCWLWLHWQSHTIMWNGPCPQTVGDGYTQTEAGCEGLLWIPEILQKVKRHICVNVTCQLSNACRLSKGYLST